MIGFWKAIAGSVKRGCARNAVRSRIRNSANSASPASVRTSRMRARLHRAGSRVAITGANLLSGPPTGGLFLFRLPDDRRRQHFDARRGRDDHHCAAPDKQAAFDGTDRHRDISFRLARIGKRPEPAIEDVIAAIGDVGPLAGDVTPLRQAAEPGERDRRRLPAKLGDFDRYRGMLAETFDKLLLIHDDYQPAARCCDNLFAQQGAAETLDQVEGAQLYLVRSVDRQVEALVFRKGCDRNAKLTGLRGCAF